MIVGEKTIRRMAAEELDRAADDLDPRIAYYEDPETEDGALDDVGAILRSWARDLHTGAGQQRAHAKRLEADQRGR